MTSRSNVLNRILNEMSKWALLCQLYEAYTGLAKLVGLGGLGGLGGLLR